MKEKNAKKKILKKINYKEKGITLTALVITIIIILILAGITLGSVTGENGLITKAKKSAEEYKKAEEDESKKILELSEILDREKVEVPDINNEEDNKQNDYENMRWKTPVVLYGEGANEEISGGWEGTFMSSGDQTTYAITKNQIHLNKGDIVSANFDTRLDTYGVGGAVGITKSGSTEQLDLSETWKSVTEGGGVAKTFSLGVLVEEEGYYNVVTKNISAYNSTRWSKVISVKIY